MGMWVAAKIEESGIEIYWQRRSIIENGKIFYLDYNGEIDSTVVYANSEDASNMVLAGEIPLSDDIVDMFGDKRLDEIIHAMCVHAVELIINGYGDSPGDVIGWFSDLSEMRFIVDGNYIVKNGRGVFEGMDSVIFNVVGDESEDNNVNCNATVAETSFEFKIDDSNRLDFLLSCVPC